MINKQISFREVWTNERFSIRDPHDGDLIDEEILSFVKLVSNYAAIYFRGELVNTSWKFVPDEPVTVRRNDDESDLHISIERWLDDVPDQFIPARVSALLTHLAKKIGYDPVTLHNMTIHYMDSDRES